MSTGLFYSGNRAVEVPHGFGQESFDLTFESIQVSTLESKPAPSRPRLEGTVQDRAPGQRPIPRPRLYPRARSPRCLDSPLTQRAEAKPSSSFQAGPSRTQPEVRDHRSFQGDLYSRFHIAEKRDLYRTATFQQYGQRIRLALQGRRSAQKGERFVQNVVVERFTGKEIEIHARWPSRKATAVPP